VVERLWVLSISQQEVREDGVDLVRCGKH
jgi:hypothetical protein